MCEANSMFGNITQLRLAKKYFSAQDSESNGFLQLLTSLPHIFLPRGPWSFPYKRISSYCMTRQPVDLAPMGQ
jgi:hypothetical protein